MTTAPPEQLGFNALVWIEALYKRIIDGVSGRGGIEAFCAYFDNIDFIKELPPLRHRMKTNSIFFETALGKCNKEMLKRPENIRQGEAFDSMGVHCEKCGSFTVGYTPFLLGMNSGVCKCGGTFEPAFVYVLLQLVHQQISPTPEAVLMSLAYDMITDAYVDAFNGVRLVMSKTARFFNWEQFRIEEPGLRNYLDNFFLGRLSGETKIPREEKETLQFIIRANIANVDLPLAEHVIRLALITVKWGYLYEVLSCSGAYPFYEDALKKFNPAYDKVNKEIREALSSARDEGKHTTIDVTKTIGGYYAPALLMPKNCWETGKLAKEIQLEPLYKMPIFPKADYGSLQAIFSRLGAGKTFILASNLSYSISNKNELTFSPLGDKSNSFSMACMPLFGYDKRTNDLLHRLKEYLDVEPQGIPVLTLNILRKGEKMPDGDDKNPPTKYDRLIEVENPKAFSIDFDEVIGRHLKDIAIEMGYSKTVGIITVRNLDRYYSSTNVNIDVQIAISLLNQFDRWRKSNLSKSGTRLLIDEISYLAPSQVTLYGSDALRSGATINDFIKESRRNKTSVDVATQLPLEIISDIRNAATNVFFRDLASSRDKSKSQIDFLLESIQLEDAAIRPVIRELNNRGVLPKYCWFWYNRPNREVQVIQPCPPTFCLQDPNKTPLQVFKEYERRTGAKILLKSWNDVESISAEKHEEQKTRKCDG